MSSAELWIVASTIIFFVLVFKPACKAVFGGLDQRRDRIVRELEEAQKLRHEAEALLADARSRHQSAAKDAGEIVQFARDEAARMRVQGEAELNEHAARREKHALDRIAQAEASALAQVRGSAIGIALAASREILSAKLAGWEGDRLVDETIAAIPAKISAGTL